MNDFESSQGYENEYEFENESIIYDAPEMPLEDKSDSKCPICCDFNVCMYHSSLFNSNINIDAQSVANVEVKEEPKPIINTPTPNTDKQSEENSEVTKGNSKRHDVCIKSILRSMRRFFCFKLETQTDYKRKEKKIKLKHETLVRCCEKITNDLGLASFSPNMSFYFSLFAYSCDMRKILEKLKANDPLADIALINKAISIINLIENALNRFSKKIFNRLIDIPEISHMIQYFLAEGHESIENTREYRECIAILDEKSKAYKYDVEKVISRAEYYISEPFFVTTKLLKP